MYTHIYTHIHPLHIPHTYIPNTYTPSTHTPTHRQALDHMYEELQAEIAIIAERKENTNMLKEDKRSLYAEEYCNYEINCSNYAYDAKSKLKELFSNRRVLAIRKVEDRLAREHQSRVRRIRIKKEEILKKVSEDDIVGINIVVEKVEALVGADVNKVLQSARALLNNFLLSRERYLEILIRQVLLEEKMVSFRVVCVAVQVDFNLKRKTLSKLELQHKNIKVLSCVYLYICV